MKIELSRDWTEFLSALISRRVRFVIVGGHAVAGHGEPRLTEDLDVFVERSPANARKLRQAARVAWQAPGVTVVDNQITVEYV